MENDSDELLPTRKSLLTRLKNWDDQEGWREFFDTYWRLIYGVALKAGLQDAEAQDVVQETIIAVARKMKGFRYDPEIGSFKGWLMLNIRSRIADHLRRRSARMPAADSPEAAQYGSGAEEIEAIADQNLDSITSLYEQEWQRNLFETALHNVKAQVSVKQFMMFDLYALKQQPLAKVTRTLGVNVAQVYLAKHRVARLLKQEVARLKKRMHE